MHPTACAEVPTAGSQLTSQFLPKSQLTARVPRWFLSKGGMFVEARSANIETLVVFSNAWSSHRANRLLGFMLLLLPRPALVESPRDLVEFIHTTQVPGASQFRPQQVVDLVHGPSCYRLQKSPPLG